MSELSYSFHLGSDKNRTKSAKKIAGNNVSNTSSYSNNSISNAKTLSKVNKHNLRDYDNKKDDIEVIFGSYDLYKDTQNLYKNEFQESQDEYNNKQKRDDRKIENYFKYVSDDKQRDLACEIIIELGDMDFWNEKDMNYKKKMTEVYQGQVYKLMELMPQFKVANAVIHYDETSPHMHIVGVPIKDDNKRGMKKQTCKSKIFTKESLAKLQDLMREDCIERFNKVYEQSAELKEKQKGRNRDIAVKDMGDYREIKKQLKQKEQKLEKANNQTKTLDNESVEIKDLLDNLKPTRLNKNNMIISNEDIDKIKNYTKNVKDITKEIRSVNDLNLAIKDFEHSAFEIDKENRSLKYQLELKDDEIRELKSEISTKDKIIGKLRAEKESLKSQLNKFKGFWHSIMSHFHNRICYDKDTNYKIVSDDLYKNGIFDDNDNEIANNIYRKVTIPDDSKQNKNKKKNDYNLN